MAFPTRAELATALGHITNALRPSAKGRGNTKNGPLLRDLNLALRQAYREADREAVPVAPHAEIFSVADLGTGTQVRLTINSTGLDSGRDTVTAWQYRIGAGAAVTISPSNVPGSTTIGSLTKDASIAITVRAVNAIGNGAWSAAKNVTPTGP